MALSSSGWYWIITHAPLWACLHHDLLLGMAGDSLGLVWLFEKLDLLGRQLYM